MSECIIIADAESEFRDSLARILQNKGFNIIVSSSGTETLQLVPRERPALVILDLLQPDVPGEEVCQLLKSDPALKQIPIVIVTSKDDLRSKVHCLDMGVEEYLVKPIAPEELVARIGRLFRLMKELRQSGPDTARESGNVTLPTIHLESEKSGKHKSTTDTSTPSETNSYGPYRLESIAGTGGMGLVYKAYEPSLDRYVAVKVLSREWSDSPEFLERFQREARLIAAINHPGIAHIYTFSEQNGESYFALQWCAGGSLQNHIKSRGKIELLPAIDIIEQCAKALEAAAAKGVVHRDVKPSNLMFDDQHQIKIVDFGISTSKYLPENPNQPAVIVGSPAFISPEQGRGENTDHRTDVYSLGITFYQMLYGRLPFTGKSPQEFLAKHNSAPFPSYDSLGGTIPRNVYKIIEKMTAKQARARYQTYTDLLKEIEKVRRELYSQRRLKVPAIQKMDSEALFQGTDALNLICDIFRSEKDGELTVRWGTLEKRFLIARNELVHFESPQLDENVWQVLIAKKLLKKEDAPPATESFEGSLNHLLYLGILQPDDLKTVYREVMQGSLEQVFLWPVLEGEFHPAKVENEPVARISLSQVLMKVVRSMIPLEQIQESISKDSRIVRTPKFEERLRSLNLSRDESFLASRIEGQNSTLETLQLLTGFPVNMVTRTVHALEKTGAVKYQKAAERRPRRMETPRVFSQAVEAASSPVEKIEEVQKPASQQKTRDWVDAAPQPDPKLASRNFKQAQQKFKDGHYWEVIRLCGQAIQNNPTVAPYHQLMAMALMNFPHSTRAAVESFRQAIQLEPAQMEYRVQLVTFLKDRQRFKEAYEECQKALDAAPGNQQVQLLLRQLELEK